ncbi:MAG: hypothetical protein JW725_04110 [Candidatus Babeliaceae bacterium]|nr:hypothetical protein [Candidatus Babeliaceae bacterium]
MKKQILAAILIFMNTAGMTAVAEQAVPYQPSHHFLFFVKRYSQLLDKLSTIINQKTPSPDTFHTLNKIAVLRASLDGYSKNSAPISLEEAAAVVKMANITLTEISANLQRVASGEYFNYQELNTDTVANSNENKLADTIESQSIILAHNIKQIMHELHEVNLSSFNRFWRATEPVNTAFVTIVKRSLPYLAFLWYFLRIQKQETIDALKIPFLSTIKRNLIGSRARKPVCQLTYRTDMTLEEQIKEIEKQGAKVQTDDDDARENGFFKTLKRWGISVVDGKLAEFTIAAAFTAIVVKDLNDLSSFIRRHARSFYEQHLVNREQEETDLISEKVI